MTAEANSRISSISGSNLNTISGSADSKNGGATRKQTPAAAPTTNTATSKRINHPIKTDEIEVQVADQNSATNPQPLSKVSIFKFVTNCFAFPTLLINLSKLL